MKSFKQYMTEMGAGAAGGGGPSNTVGSIAGSGDSRLPASQREPGVSRKKKVSDPRMPMGIGKRKDF